MDLYPSVEYYFQTLLHDLQNNTVDDYKYGLKLGGGKLQKRNYIQTNKIKSFLINSKWKKYTLPRSLNNLHDSLHDGHTPIITTIGFARAYYNQFGYQGSIYKTLIKCGIYKERALEIENALSSLYNTSYSNDQLIHIAFDFLFGKYDPIMPENVKFLTEYELHKWHTKEDINIQIMNFEFPCSLNFYTQINSYTHKIPFNRKTHQAFFHATNWRGLYSISNQINHNAGRHCLDFGYHPGFYLTPTFKDAVEWGEKRSKNFYNEIAIIIFILPKVFKTNFNYLELNGDDWIKIVAKSRHCKNDIKKNIKKNENGMIQYINDHEMPELRSKDFIYGSILKNPESVIKSSRIPIPFDDKKQLVSKTDMGDNFLHSCMYGAFIFQKDFTMNKQTDG